MRDFEDSLLNVRNGKEEKDRNWVFEDISWVIGLICFEVYLRYLVNKFFLLLKLIWVGFFVFCDIKSFNIMLYILYVYFIIIFVFLFYDDFFSLF